MVIEEQLPPFLAWLLGPVWYQGAGLYWLAVVGCLSLSAVIVGFLCATIRRGPVAGLKATRNAIREGLVDLVKISPRRVVALTRLAVKESIGKKIVVGFAVFIVVLMLAGWFLDPGSENPGRLYLSFVLTATSYLVLLLALFLSAFSLPGDIRSRTLHTVVTKPVRPSEIVLGRILGFTAIGTFLLIVMGSLSYLFVVQGLSHTHTITAEDLEPVDVAQEGADPNAAPPLEGQTSLVHNHRHHVSIDPSGVGRLERANGHTHELSTQGSGYKVGPTQGALLARVPIYGKLSFRDRDGLDKEMGINVGDEWFYRSFIAGGTQAAAIWTFSGVREDAFPGNEIPVEMTLGVFRTHKGKITRPVLGSLSVRNPETGLTVDVEIFESREFEPLQLALPTRIDRNSVAGTQLISRKANSPDGPVLTPPTEMLDQSLAQKEEFNLFEDLVADGKMEIWLRCLESGQYFGAAQPDLYFRADDASVELNFIKGYCGIWMQMVLVIAVGVMFSTFLSGPVAMIATLGSMVGGFFGDFMMKLAEGAVVGGGPLESLVRLITQKNVSTDLDPGLGTDITLMADRVFQVALRGMASVLPPFGDFNYATYLAYGFDVSWNVVCIRLVTALAFLFPLFIAGHLFLRNREVAR
jgi:hypothetical protein